MLLIQPLNILGLSRQPKISLQLYAYLLLIDQRTCCTEQTTGLPHFCNFSCVFTSVDLIFSFVSLLIVEKIGHLSS